MESKIKETLSSLGLDNEEILIYLFILQNGSSAQQQVSEATGLLRQTIYDRIRRLENTGIISRVNEVGRPLFMAVPPVIFLEQLKEKEEQVRLILPKLKEMSGVADNQITSTTFSGLKSLKKLTHLTLGSVGEILWIANKKTSDEVFGEHFWFNYGERRKKVKNSIKLLIEPTSDNAWRSNKNAMRYTKTHEFVRKQNSSLILFNNQVIIYTVKKGSYHGVHIVDNFLCKFFSDLFHKLWKEGSEI